MKPVELTESELTALKIFTAPGELDDPYQEIIRGAVKKMLDTRVIQAPELAEAETDALKHAMYVVAKNGPEANADESVICKLAAALGIEHD